MFFLKLHSLVFSLLLITVSSNASELSLETENVEFSGMRNEFSHSDNYGARPLENKLEKSYINMKLVSKAVVSKSDDEMRYTYHQNWKTRTKQMVLVGDSNTFGWGLNNDETLSYWLAKKFKQYRIYNFSEYGGGPHDNLKKLEDSKLLDKLPQNNGVMLFQFFSYYHLRVMGALNYMSWPESGKRPWYQISSEGVLQYKGVFKDRWYSGLYDLLNYLKPEVIEYNFPKVRDEDINLTFKIISKIKDIYKKKFPNNHFYILLMPNFYDDPIHKASKKYMRLFGINYIEMETLKEYLRKDSSILFKSDKHLTDKANEVIAQDVFNALEKEK